LGLNKKLSITSMGQCCQRAEILAAKHKWGQQNFVGPGKFGAELLADLSKRAGKGPNFVVVWIRN
jgi:hypothetical protein